MRPRLEALRGWFGGKEILSYRAGVPDKCLGHYELARF